MGTDALDRGTAERYLVGRAEVVAADEAGIELATVALRDPWPPGPFPAPPDATEQRRGRLRIEVVGDDVLHIRYAVGDRVRDGGSHMVVGEPGPPAGVAVVADGLTVSVSARSIRADVSTDPYGVVVRDGAGRVVTRVGGPDPSYFRVADSLGTGVNVDVSDGRPVATETFGLGSGDAVYGFGEGFVGFDKRGQTLDLWVSDAMGVHTPRVYKAVPFFVTTGGFGVFVHTSAAVRAWVGTRAAHQVQVAVDDDVLDVYVFAGSIRRVLAAYTGLTGRAPMPPNWSFGWWQSKCSYVSAEETLRVVRELRAEGFPFDVIHLDTAWFRTDWLCDLEFAPDRFPDPVAYCEELRRNGVHLSLWQTPYLVTGTRLHDRVAEAGGFVLDRSGEPYDVGIHFVRGYDGPVHCVDWSNPEAVRVMQDEYARLLRTGASVIKVDFGEEVPVDGVYADGTPGERMHNLYPLRYQKAVHEVTGRERGEAVAWSRSGWAGAQRYPVHWGGDVPPVWELTGPQLVGGLSLGMSGFTFWSADIGGTGELPDDPELLIRWLQWGILLSNPRIHGVGEREPHRWDEPLRSIAREWLRLRYRLLPYVLASARSASAAGLPFARPLVVEFQDDPTTWPIGDQFLCGDSLLVAPLLGPGGRRRVYLPAGTWIDWWNREAIAGPRWIEVEHGLETAPLYVREGGVVPLGPPMAHVGELPTDPLSVLVAPFTDAGETAIEVPEDDGPIRIAYRASAHRHEVVVAGAPGRVELDVLSQADVDLRVQPRGGGAG